MQQGVHNCQKGRNLLIGELVVFAELVVYVVKVEHYLLHLCILSSCLRIALQ